SRCRYLPRRTPSMSVIATFTFPAGAPRARSRIAFGDKVPCFIRDGVCQGSSSASARIRARLRTRPSPQPSCGLPQTGLAPEGDGAGSATFLVSNPDSPSSSRASPIPPAALSVVPQSTRHDQAHSPTPPPLECAANRVTTTLGGATNYAAQPSSRTVRRPL